MERLSLERTALEKHYTVVVVGSGYGGGVAASRLARAGQKVCVLERGREWQPGDFPNTVHEAEHEVQLNILGERGGRADGLYDIHIDEDINVFKGCGLGGTSLVNANVALQADPRVFLRPCWPPELTQDHTGLQNGYANARAMLEPTEYPEDFPPLRKLEAHRRSAERLKRPFRRVPINVSFKDRVNAVGVEQKKCNGCGDCVTGCNFGAKNNVAMNYLPDAKKHGAQIFTGITVRWLERTGAGWVVHYLTDDGSPGSVSADIVVVSAGTLGSTEILLRSKDRGLALSPKLGELFTGNGDFLAFGYNNDMPINGVGFGDHAVAGREPVGPCITSAIDGREQTTPLDDSMIIEEGSLPGAIGKLMPGLLEIAAQVAQRDTDAGVMDRLREGWRELKSWLLGPYHGAVHNTQTYLVMTHDDGKGKMWLDGDSLRISWPGVSEQPIFDKVSAALLDCTRANGGTYIPTPTWSNHLKKSLITVHPLGGCAMGHDASSGVTNHRGQVYSGTTGVEVHEGLFVADGSVIPTPVGVNPLLTITALAERSMQLLAQEKQWSLDNKLPARPA